MTVSSLTSSPPNASPSAVPASLVLLLANHIGDTAIVKEALERARASVL